MFCVLNTGVSIASDLIQVNKVVWTEAVDRDKLNYIHAYKSPVQLRHISLWMELRGSQELLQLMNEGSDGKVYIRHVWKKYVLDELQPELDQELAIGRKEDTQRLYNEVAITGYFTWRTWSDKVSLTPGNWQVDLLWGSNEPVMCTNSKGELKACSYTLQVR